MMSCVIVEGKKNVVNGKAVEVDKEGRDVQWKQRMTFGGVFRCLGVPNGMCCLERLYNHHGNPNPTRTNLPIVKMGLLKRKSMFKSFFLKCFKLFWLVVCKEKESPFSCVCLKVLEKEPQRELLCWRYLASDHACGPYMILIYVTVRPTSHFPRVSVGKRVYILSGNRKKVYGYFLGWDS